MECMKIDSVHAFLLFRVSIRLGSQEILGEYRKTFHSSSFHFRVACNLRHLLTKPPECFRGIIHCWMLGLSGSSITGTDVSALPWDEAGILISCAMPAWILVPGILWRMLPIAPFLRGEPKLRCAVQNKDAWKAVTEKYQKAARLAGLHHGSSIASFPAQSERVGTWHTETVHCHPAEDVLKGKAQIPKVIHQIWIGPKVIWLWDGQIFVTATRLWE